MCIKVTNIFDEFIKIYLRPADIFIFLRREPLQRDTKCIQSRIDQRISKSRTKQRCIRDDLNAFSDILLLGNAHHIGNMRIEQRFPLSCERQHLEFMRKLGKLIDGLYIGLHRHVLRRKVILFLHLSKAKGMSAVGTFEVAESRWKDESTVWRSKRKYGGKLDTIRPVDRFNL